jgi:hypothetical protein
MTKSIFKYINELRKTDSRSYDESIEGSKVTLIVTGNNTEKTKTINIDWITD